MSLKLTQSISENDKLSNLRIFYKCSHSVFLISHTIARKADRDRQREIERDIERSLSMFMGVVVVTLSR